MRWIIDIPANDAKQNNAICATLIPGGENTFTEQLFDANKTPVKCWCCWELDSDLEQQLRKQFVNANFTAFDDQEGQKGDKKTGDEFLAQESFTVSAFIDSAEIISKP